MVDAKISALTELAEPPAAGDFLPIVDTDAAVTKKIKPEYLNVVPSQLNNFYNGTFVETFTATVTSDGANITFALEQSGGGNLTMIFSDGLSVLVAAPATIFLVEGSAVAPKKNYVYVLQSTKALAVSDTGWPVTEHIKVAEVVVQTVAIVLASGCNVLRQWNDHKSGTNNQGHLSHVAERIRWEHSAWYSGVAETLTITPGAPDTINFAVTAGMVYQMHQQDTPIKSVFVDEILVVNDSGTAYTRVADLADLLTDSTGASMSGKSFSLVVWMTVSSNNQNVELFVNLPRGSYTQSDDAISDPDKYANYSIPLAFRGYAFLISRLVLTHSAAGGGTWTSQLEEDLRGYVPSLTGGGAGGGALINEFVDSAFRVYDNGDPTKKVALETSGVSASTTRTVTIQNADGTMAYLSDTIKTHVVYYQDIVAGSTGGIEGGRAWADETLNEGDLDAQVDVPRAIVVATVVNAGTAIGTVTVNGIDCDGAVIAEIITINESAGTEHVTTKAFARITSIVSDKTDGETPGINQYSIGVSAQLFGVGNKPLNASGDVYKIKKNTVDVTGWTVDTTNSVVDLGVSLAISVNDDLTFWMRPNKA